MVDVIGEPEGPDHADHVLKVQQKAEQKPFRVRRHYGAPNPDTRLGEQQLRRQARASQPDSLASPGFSRWKNT